MTYFVGIDLGTTYTAAAIYRNGRSSIFSLGGRSASIPSVVLLREDETVLTGDAAVRRAITEPERVAREFKRRLGDTTPIIVGGSPYSAEALMSRLLKSVLEEVEKREGSPPEGVAVSHPANWGPYKIDLLKQAIRLAGLDVDSVELLTEPEAAVISYASQERVEAGEVVAVYDLGGGTFDAAVLRRTADGFEIIGKPEGIERLGGIDFDAAVFAHVARSLDGALQQLDPEDPAAQAAMSRLRRDCVEAKEALSSDTDATIPVLLPTLQTDVRITRREYEALIRPSLVDSIEAMRRALASAGVTTDEVSRVLLIGGSSRTPLIAQLVSSELGRPVAVDAHPKHAVALGASVAASGSINAAAPAAAASTPPTPAPVVEAPLTPTPPTPAPPAAAPPTPAPIPPTPAAAPPRPAPPTPEPVKPAVAPIFEEPPPDVPAGVPIVPSAQAPTPAPRPVADTPTQAIPTTIQTPTPTQTFSSEAPGAAVSSATSVSTAKKGRGPLIAALVAAVLVFGVGGFAYASGLIGGDDAADDAADSSTSTTAADDSEEPGTGAEAETTTTTEPATTTTAAPLTDAELKAEIVGLLGDDVVELDVQVTEGTATLGGFVLTLPARIEAENAVGELPDVSFTVNNIIAGDPDEWCDLEVMSHDRWVCLTDARFEDGFIKADYAFFNSDEALNKTSGYHLHVFGTNIEPVDAGGPGAASNGNGPWIIWDTTPGFEATPAQIFGSSDIPEKLCARIANPSHQLDSLESGNCIPIRIIG